MAIDTSYLYFRAFYGMPASVRDAQGNPVNAVRGVLDSLANLIRQHSPDLLACAWDEDWRPAWRTELIPSYKAHRVANRDTEGKDSEEVPQELAVQVPVIKDVLASLGLPVMGVAGYEADDVLASLAARHEGTTLVVTGDRDLFQLIDPTTSVVNLAGSGGASNLVDELELFDRYQVQPDRYVDLAVLRGDPSDGLPGVKGVGDKTAARLIAEYDSLEALIADAIDGSGTLSPALRRNLAAAADYVERARKVVLTVADLQLPAPTVLPVEVDPQLVARWREDAGLGRSIDRIAVALAQRGE